MISGHVATYEVRYVIAEGKSLQGPWVLCVEGDLVTTTRSYKIARKFLTKGEARTFLQRHGLYSGYHILRVPVQTGGIYIPENEA